VYKHGHRDREADRGRGYDFSTAERSAAVLRPCDQDDCIGDRHESPAPGEPGEHMTKWQQQSERTEQIVSAHLPQLRWS
jgi:hypothetical protein